ncbi:MAG: transcription termination/antitermination protein NusA [Dehalococcoidia bacterium]|nr:transcription termination/antitermination protein NusA [Dehalococcoidia bacterium]
MKSDFMMALNQLSAERGLRKELVLDKVEVALATAFRRDRVAGSQNLAVKLNPNTGDISIFPLLSVVEEIEDPETEIILADALKIQPSAQIGSEISEANEVAYDTSRISAQTARQVLMQGLREAEREKIFEEYSSYEGEIISGNIESIEKGPTVFVNLNPHQAQNQNRARGIMRPDHQVHNERYRKGQNLKVLLVEVQQTTRGPEVIVSRSHRDLLRRLMEAEVPEISNGTVEIRAIARDPGIRSKVAVASHQEGVDPVGSCIGLRGNRIQSIVNELQGEKIDVIEWNGDAGELIRRALSPAEVQAVETDQAEKTAYVVVPESQMSLAIGRDGQNARLAARLSGWRLDIKNVEQWEALRVARAAEAARVAAEEAALNAEREAAERAAAEEAAAAAAEADVEAIQAVAETDDVAVGEVELATLPDLETTADVVEMEVATPVEDAAPAAAVVLEPVAEALPEIAIVPPAPAEPEIDEDALLEALMAEEEAAAAAQAQEPAVPADPIGLSVDDLDGLTIDDVVEDEEDELDYEDDYDEEEPAEDMADLLAGLPNLAPDAGKIRFAEDIVGEFRGGDRRRRRGGGANRRGGNVPGARGPGPRRR